MRPTRKQIIALVAGLLVASAASANLYQDDFSGTAANLDWTPLGDACLTAGDDSGSIPSCKSRGIAVATDETVPGQGALLLTPATEQQAGAILSAFKPFPLNEGIEITFTTYTFGGDRGGLAGNGADGMAFFLTDGTKDPPTETGANGGSLGYSCSNLNVNANGLAYAYLGLGIDEYGNYLNSGDNGSKGIYNTHNASYGTTIHGTNKYQDNANNVFWSGGGGQFQPQRIGLRGAGNTTWAWLQGMNEALYTGTYSPDNQTQVDLLHAACSTGKYIGTDGQSHDIDLNYNPIDGGYSVLPDDMPLANDNPGATRNPSSDTDASAKAWPITYRLSITPAGLLSFAYSYNNGDFKQVLTNYDIKSNNGPLPETLRFGFSAGTGSHTNIHEITCFKASSLQSNSSAGSNTVTGKTYSDTQFFLAAYSTNNWWGSMVAAPLVTLPDGSLAVGTQANWDAGCTLTGGGCATMGVDDDGQPLHTVTGQKPEDRYLLTSNALGAGHGVTLTWDALGSDQQAALNKLTTINPLDTTPGQNRLRWLRGDRRVEQLAAGCSLTQVADPPCDMRSRTKVLGDIINSSPTFVGSPPLGVYPDTFKDLLHPDATVPENADDAQSHDAFASAHAQRLNVVYVGANDGFVHGFEAGSFDADGKFDSTSNDGKEVIGYMPYDVLKDKAASLANPNYQHDYLVDATPVAADVFYASAWHTWLVGGVGSSGQEIYALDVTDPSGFATSDVIGDWDSETLENLGNTVGTPIIARMHNGQWAIIFGTGLVKNATGKSPDEGVYVGLIDPASGAVSFEFLDTGAAPLGVNGNPGGIAYVSSSDLDGDAVADYLYAGDTQGRVWRFDVTDANATAWSGATTNSTPKVVFTATDSAGNAQPITTAIMPVTLQNGSLKRAMLYFGTGQQVQSTVAHGVQYAQGTQTFYGIWDWDMGGWNKLSDTDYAALAGTQSVDRDHLLAQSVVDTLSGDGNPIKGYRTLSTSKEVCWQGMTKTTSCPSPDQYGWRFDLPDQGPTAGEFAGQHEQIIYNAAFADGAIVVNTAIPPIKLASQCNAALQTGWTMAFNPSTGGGFTEGYFSQKPGSSGDGSTGDGSTGEGSSGEGSSGNGSGAEGPGSGSSGTDGPTDKTATTAGIQLGGVGTITTYHFGGNDDMVTQTVRGGAQLQGINPPSSGTTRVSWREVVGN